MCVCVRVLAAVQIFSTALQFEINPIHTSYHRVTDLLLHLTTLFKYIYIYIIYIYIYAIYD
jgi:hypothetical protein